MTSPTYTRPIHASDVSELADVAADCFKEDEIFVATWPLRYGYYDMYRRSWLRSFRSWLVRRGIHGFVIRHVETNEVVGAAIWRRQGPESSAVARGWMERNSDISSAIERTLRGWEERYINVLRLESPAADVPFIFRWESACGELAKKWENVLPDKWHLHLMMVSEKYRRQGFGSKLMKWGVNQAKDERVPLTLFASHDGVHLYEKHGLRSLDTVFVRDEKTGKPINFGPMMVGNWGGHADVKETSRPEYVVESP